MGQKRKHGLVIDLFAGGGGASKGIEAALGRRVDIAINHDALALAVHAKNHPHTVHYVSDVWEVDPLEVTRGRPVDVLWASPDCFPAGTMVLTHSGYRAIEGIQVGDEVLTHLGRWRKVTATMSAVKPLVRVRGHGHPGLIASAEHPFYVRHRKRQWNNERRAYDKPFSAPEWVTAGKLEKGMYWASPVEFPAAEPPQVPVYNRRTMTLTPELLWLAGLYVADGCTFLTEKKAELIITCGHHEVKALRERLSHWTRAGARAGADEFSWQERETSTAYQFATSHRGFVEWLRLHFGHGAPHKRIPGWALGMSAELRQALLEGYLSGDGWCSEAGRIVEGTTVSKALAFGLKALAGSLGKTVAVYTQQNTGIIQGRVVNARPAWRVRWRDEVDGSHQQAFRFEEDSHLEWAPIREREDLGQEAKVFNLSVDEDETYVVEGIVQHNCTHFSVAKGGTPREKRIRSLAWVVVEWARKVKPRCIFLENVREFETWGPLGDDGLPDKERMGETFEQWRGSLEILGYRVDYRVLSAADYGAPTWRRRLFLVARRDGQPVLWPEVTHGEEEGLAPYHTAAECIDWTRPCPSIFTRKRKLAPKTMWRIAEGLDRFVFGNPTPFVIPQPFVMGVGGRAGQTPPTPVEAPMGTITAKNDRALLEPYLVKVNHGGMVDRSEPLDAPLSTVTASRRGHALVAPTLIQTGYGERKGQRARSLNIREPLGTVMATGQKHALVSAFLNRHFGGPRAPHPGLSLTEPLSTVTAKDHHSLAAVALAHFRGTGQGQPGACSVEEPLPTITAGGIHVAEVRAFLASHYGAPGREVKPTEYQQLGIVSLGGVLYQIVDIGMRMLEPEELLRAQFGRFAPEYDLGLAKTKAAKVRLIGNSVAPEVAEAVVRANFGDGISMRRTA